MCAEVAKIYGKKESSIRGIAKKEKEICTRFAVAFQSAQAMATVCGKCLVKIKKPLHSYHKIFCERDHIHITFIIVYCYNYSISLLGIVVNLLLCLIYKLNFTIGMCV